MDPATSAHLKRTSMSAGQTERPRVPKPFVAPGRTIGAKFSRASAASSMMVSDPTKRSLTTGHDSLSRALATPSPQPVPPPARTGASVGATSSARPGANLYPPIPAAASTSKLQNSGNMHMSDSSKTIFDSMSFDEALLYLTTHRSTVEYLHCVPRHLVDKKSRTNTYDIVVLEKPGHPQSDQIFSRSDRKDVRKQGKYPGKLMQLSLQGVVMDADEPHGGTAASADLGNGQFVPLKTFKNERDLCFVLLEKSFFRNFKQYKIFTAWKVHTRQTVFQRRMTHVQTSTVFADAPLVSLISEIYAKLHTLREHVDLFEYFGSGLLNARSYLLSQEKKMYVEFAKIKSTILEIGELIEARYLLVVSTSYMGAKIDEIIVHHPYSMSKASGAGLLLNTTPLDDVDWEHVRSVQRLKAEYKDKIEKIFRCAEFMTESMIGTVLLRFLARLSKSILGVPIVNRDTARAFVGYWVHSAEDIKFDTQEAKYSPSKSVQPFSEEHTIDDMPNRGEIDDATSRKGRHITINTAFFLESKPFDPGAQVSARDISKLKIAVDPSSSQVMHYLHDLYGVLGVLLSNLPKLKYHPVIYKEEKKIDIFQEEGSTQAATPAKVAKRRSHWHRGEHASVPTAESEAALVSAARNLAKSSSGSSVLFVYIQNCQILVQMGTQQIFVKTLHQFRLAVVEASEVEDITSKLNDIFQQMWALNPNGVLKQLERSSLLPLLKDGVNGNQHVSADDIERSVNRERGRLTSLLSSISYLEAVETMLQKFPDLKHSQGVVCSFKIATQQLSRIREKQIVKLTSAIPITFISRCRLFTDFLFSVQNRLDPSLLGGFEKEIKMLKAVEYFDAAKALFDEECDICEKIYRKWWDQKVKDDGSDAPTLKRLPSQAGPSKSDVEVGPHTRIKNASSNPLSLFVLYTEAKNACNDSIIGCRLELGKVLPHIKKQVLQRVQELHTSIEAFFKDLDDLVELSRNKNKKIKTEDFLGIDDGDSFASSSTAKKDILDGHAVQNICDLLDDMEVGILLLRKEVKEVVSIQELLLQSHVIVGSALPILSAEEVVYFKDMELLESTFQIKNKSWISVGEALSIHATISRSRLGNSNVPLIYERVNAFSETIEFLKLQVDSNNPALLRLKKAVYEIKPQLELLAYLTCEALRRSHWEELADSAFYPLNYNLFISGHGVHSVTVSKLVAHTGGGTEWKNLGSLRTLPLAELMSHGLFEQLHRIKEVTALAMMQSLIEKTLTASTFCMNNSAVALSNDWLSDPRLRDKIPFDLQRVVNCDELSVLFQYCYKAVLVAEHTAVDMNIGIFDNRINETKTTLGNIIDFIRDLDLIQQRWISLFKFIKFSAQGDLDRETVRLYQTCTEEVKKIEILLNEGSGHSSFLDSFIRLTESETNPKMILTNLSIVIEDVHSSVQSVLDACPRLSLLPYHRLKELIKLWISSPLNHMGFVSECFHEMFEGVGSLRIEELRVQGIHVCKGFLSRDKAETILFDKPITISVPIDDFVNTFEKNIRSALAKGCDAVSSHRVELTKILLNDVLPERVVLVTKEIFSARVSLIKPQEFIDISMICNQSIILTNLAIFAEDVWLCLGYAVGTIPLTKPKLDEHLGTTFVPAWRNSLNVMFGISTHMIAYCQAELSNGNTSQQRRALCSSLLQLEVGHLQTVKDLMQCNCRESALEMWSGRYQLRFLYVESERVRHCPFEVMLGCVCLPYGMEYYGGLFPLHLGPGIEYAVSKAIGSAFSYKGTIFLSYETDESPLEVQGEYSVSCKDVSIALGRVFNVLASVHNLNSVKLFLARLIYLDAVGCVDFTTMGEAGIQMIVDTLAQMWTAIERKDDFFMIGSLKYPLKTNALRAPTQASTRRKSAVSNFMHSMNTKGAVYSGIYLIGMASETLYSEVAVFNQFSNSVFNTVAIDNNRPTEDLGVMLSVAGFSCGVLLQELFEHVVMHVKRDYKTIFPSLSVLTSTRYNRLILKRASEFHATEKYFHIAANKGQSLGGFVLLRFEVQIFVNALWDVMLTCIGPDSDKLILDRLRESVVGTIQEQLNVVLSDVERFQLDPVIATAKKTISLMAEQEIQRAARSLKFTSDPIFLANCYALWQQLCSKSSCLGIVHGSCGSGKTAIRNTVLNAMRAFKGLEFVTPSVVSSNSSALAGWRAALMLTRVVKRWKLRKQMFVGDDFYSAVAEPATGPALERPVSGSGKSRPGTGFNDSRRTTTAAPPEEDKHSIKSIIIHHASMSCDHFIGMFDGMGRWSDGLLLRTIRGFDSNSLQRRAGSVHSNFCVIVLDGPLGSQIEQLFSGSRYKTCKGMPANHEVDNNLVVFPSGESCVLSSEVSVLIETSDLSHASPPMLLYTAKIDVSVGSTHSAKRLIQSWVNQFIPELLKYGPWEEAGKELEELLNQFSLINDLLYFDSAEKSTACASAVSRTNSFLRYLEELLLQCHELFLSECVIVTPEDRTAKPSSRGGAVSRQGSAVKRQTSLSFMLDDDDISDAVRTEQNTSHADVTYLLDPSGQELILQRCRCVVMYAAIWSFGGAINGTDRRGFFETVARLSFTDKFGPYAEFPSGCSLFELTLDLKEACFVEALEYRRRTHPVHGSLKKFLNTSPNVYETSSPARNYKRAPETSQQYETIEKHHTLSPIDVEEVETGDRSSVLHSAAARDEKLSQLDFSADPTVLQFHTPGTIALVSTLDILFRSGGRVLLNGMACSGKTSIMTRMLRKYGSRCPHPRNMKSDMLRCLLDIIAGEKMPDGTPAVLDILTSFLNRIGSNSGLGEVKRGTVDGKEVGSAALWYAIRRILQENDSYKSSTRDHCLTSTVFSSAVSLRVVPTADALRAWLVRELGTENGNVLEAPRFTRAVIFIDDLHMAVNHSNSQGAVTSDRTVENLLEGLLRGLLQSHGSFIDPSAFRSNDKHDDKKKVEKTVKQRLEEYLSEANSNNRNPVVHRTVLTDPRVSSQQTEDYYMDDVGILAAATGNIKTLESRAELKQLVQYFCIVSTPVSSISEIHSALLHGSSRVLYDCPLELTSGGPQVLNACLVELSTASVAIMKLLTNTSKNSESGLSLLEGSQRKLLFLSMPVIQRLCATLSIARQLITSQFSLLQLWVHEWKRNYLDIFPHGIQRSRVVEMLQEQLDKIDIKKWHISSTAFQSIVNDTEVATGSVWVDVDRLLKRPPRDGIETRSSDKYESLHVIEEEDEESMLEYEDNGAATSADTYFYRYTPVAMYIPEINSEIDKSKSRDLNPTDCDVHVCQDEYANTVPLKLSIPSSLSVLSALYPAALAMMLRIVRVLTSISAHVVLSGFIGSARLPVLHIAASIAHFGIEVYEVGRCQKATEFNLSTDHSTLSLDFKGFLKSCVMRCCGVKLEKSIGSSFGPASFSSTQGEPIMVTIMSAQLLNPEERRTLLHIIEGDYAALFENREIEGLAALFHDQFLAASSGEKRATYTPDVEESDISDLEEASITSDPNQEDHPRQDVTAKADGDGGKRKLSTAVKMESMLAEMKEQSNVTKKSGWGRSVGSSKMLLGYTYNWVKSVLREHVFGKLKIVLSVDFPRVAPISTASTSAEASSENIFQSTNAEPVGEYRPPKRFSLMSGRSHASSIATGSVVQESEGQRPASKSRPLRSREGAKRSATVNADDGGVSVRTEQPFLLNSGNDNSTEVNYTKSGNLFYECPVLGGVLTHKFCHLWWDISSFQSIQGVCFNLLRSFDSMHFQSPHKVALASRNILLVESSENQTSPSKEPSVPVCDLSVKGITKWSLQLYCRGNAPTSYFYRKLSNIQNLGVFMTFAKKDGLYMSKAAAVPQDLESIAEDTINTPADGPDFSAANRRRRSSIQSQRSAEIARAHEEAAQLESSTNEVLEAMVDEARHILPHLLALECPADSVILNQPVITMEPDKSAEVTCRIVLQMIEDGGRMLLRRRDDCIAVEAMHKHSLFVLASVEPIMSHLKASVEEMHRSMRELSSSLIDVENDTASCRVDFTKTPQYEQYLSCIEDIVSTEDNIKHATRRLDAITAASKANLLSVNIRDWNLFGKLVEDSKSFVAYGMTTEIVHMLRGVILLADPHIRSKSSGEIAELNQLNSETDSEASAHTSKSKLNELRDSVILKSAPVVNKSEFGSAPGLRNPTRFASPTKRLRAIEALRTPVVTQLTDDEVYPQASALLSSPDVISRLLSRNFTNISPSHVLELKAINALMRKADTDRIEAEIDDDADTIGTSTTQSDSDLAGHLISKLKELLFGLELVVDDWVQVHALNASLEEKKQQCKYLHSEIEAVVAEKLKCLENKKNSMEQSLQLLDSEITHSRIKVARLTNLETVREKMIKAVEEHRQYVLNERKQLDSILRNLVADSCVAGACLTRVGWLPEQIRQECLEKFRKDLLLHKRDMGVTESPFILGCMLDRLQVKRWTLNQQSTDTLPRDPGSINSMSLVMMNPVFSFVVDPEGSAAAPIKNASREHYSIFEVTGAIFSLEKLERVLVEARGSKSVACIVTECQAGVSQDLITFLSADYNWTQQHPDNSPTKGLPEEQNGSKTTNPTDRVGMSGLAGVFNGDRTDSSSQARIHKIFSFFGNLRVVLVSALGPIVDSSGYCTPLPPSCFKNMLTIHWTSCHHSSYYMDPKPFHSALGKTFAADYLLENCMVESICREIAPTHSIQSRLLSERVIEWSMRIINQEGDVTSNLVKWVSDHSDDAVVPALYNRNINLKYSYMTIGYLVNEHCCNGLLFAESKRNYLDKGVQSAKRLERDMICYQNAVGEACAMAADFFRVASVVLPVNLLPPYALTAKAVAAKCVTGMITHNVELLSMIPSSLKDVHRILKGIQVFQKQFLRTRGKAKQVAVRPPATKIRMHPAVSRVGGMRSSFLGQRGSTLAAIIATPDDEIDNAVIAAQCMQVTLNRNGQPQVLNPSAPAEAIDPNNISGSASGKDGPMYLENMMGMRRRDRLSAVNGVHFFLEPVRSILLKAAVAYVYNEVKPGFEWMVKFSILLTTWAQSSTPLPTDELRALFHFYSRIFSGDAQRVRYAFISATAAVPQDVEDTVEVGLPVSTILLKNEAVDDEDDGGTHPTGHRIDVQTSKKRISMIEQLVSTSVDEFDVEDNVDGGSLPTSTPLPNVLSLKDRRTGFWGSESKPLSNGIKLLQNSLASFAIDKSYLNSLIPAATLGVSQTAPPRAVRSGSTSAEYNAFRGPGGIDGLSIHRRSTRWRIKYEVSQNDLHIARDGSECGQPIIRWDPVLCDVPGAEVTVKNEIFRARIVVGNMFELDWLHAMKGRSSSVSIPGVDTRSNMLHGSMRSVTSGSLDAHMSDMGDSKERRKSSVLRMTRITSRKKNSLRASNYGNRGVSVVRRHSNKSKKSIIRTSRISVASGTATVSEASKPSGHSRSDPNMTPAARASNLRMSLARRSVRKQSISFVDSPVQTKTKRLSNRVGSIRKSGLVKKLSLIQRDCQNLSDYGGEQKDLSTPEKSRRSGSSHCAPPDAGSNAADVSPIVQAALAAAQKHRQKQGNNNGSPTKGGQASPSQRPDLSKGILALFESIDNYKEFKILERHPSLAPVFRGMSEGIGLYPDQFLEWKKFVRSLSSINFSNAKRADLVHLAANIIPPQLEMEPTDVYRGTNGLGLWAAGKELTVIQTLLLTTVVSPSSCRAVAELMFSLTDQYLERGGVVVRHQDELSSDEDSDTDEDCSEDEFSDDDGDGFNTITEGNEDDDEEGDEERDAFNSLAGLDEEYIPPSENTMNFSNISSNYDGVIKPSAAFLCDDDDDDDDISVSSRGSRNSERYRRGSRLQMGVSALNCWTHLKHAAAGVIRPPGVRYAKKHSQYRNTCRTFENWEAVLKEVLSTSFEGGELKLALRSSDNADAVTFGGQMENDEDAETESTVAVCTLRPFSALIKQSKYRILAEQRSAAVTYRPFMPIFLGSRDALGYMSYLSLVCRELSTYKSFHYSSSPRAAVINCSLLEKSNSKTFHIGMPPTGSSNKISAAAKSVADRQGRPTEVHKVEVAGRTVSNPDRLRELIKIVERGISTTAYLKIPSAKPNGGIINILEMLDMHSPVCSSIVWAAAVHHRSVRARPEVDDFLSDASSYMHMSNSLMAASVATSTTVDASMRSVTLEGLLGKAINKRPMSAAPRKDISAVGKLAPVPLTAFWDTNSSGFGPLMSLSEFQFHWLPAITIPDLISTGEINEATVVQETPRQAVEGLIWEQLHSSFLYTFNTIKRLGKITTDSKMKERIKNFSDIEVRVTSGVVTLWRFILFLRSRDLEMAGKPGAWSQCLVPLSMWQIARIVFKVSDILKENWVFHLGSARGNAPKTTGGELQQVGITVEALLECPHFHRVIALCAESLCYISYDDESSPRQSDFASAPSTTMGEDAVPRRRETNIRSSIIRSKHSMVERTSSVGSAARGRPAARRTVSRTLSSFGGAGTPLAVPVPPTTVRPSNSLQFNLTSFSRSFAGDENYKENGTELQGGATELSFPSFNELTEPGLFLKYKYKSSFGGVEMRDRLLSTLGRYMAEVLVLRLKETVKVGGELKQSISKVGTASTPYSIPANIALYTAPGGSNQGKRVGEEPTRAWPVLAKSGFDISVGTVGSDGVIRYITRWSLSEE